MEFGFFGTFRGAVRAFRVRGFGSNLRLGSAVLARRPRKVSRRKAQGSGFKGSGNRLRKVQSGGLGFGVKGLGFRVEGSGFRLQGFRLQAQVQAAGLWARFRLLGREPEQSQLGLGFRASN